MTKHSTTRIAMATLLACLSTTPALAAMITHVSTKGADSGTCATLATACRTFAYAQTKTDAGGEILALDAGDYGEVTITKSLAITGTVEGAGVYGNGANVAAIAVAAGPTDVVDLTGLTIDGMGVRGTGIQSDSVGFLTVRNTSVRNTTFTGIFIWAAAAVLVEDSHVTNAGNDGFAMWRPGVVHRASVFGVGASGIAVFIDGNLTISETTLSRNDRGVHGDPRLHRSVSTGNRIGLNNFANTESAGDNFIRDNTTNWNSAPILVGRQ